jgi:predicted Fe-Mo cluster-binding NifX family protein
VIVCVPVKPSGEIDPRWGRAARVAIVEVQDGQLVRWEEHEVGWDTLHDEGTEGGHHARVARFLQEQHVEVVVAGHMGPPMAQMLERMGLEVHPGAVGDAGRAVLYATVGRST